MLNRACPRPTSRHGATKACAACPAGKTKVWGSTAAQSPGAQRSNVESREHGGWGRHQGQEGVGQPGAHTKPALGCPARLQGYHELWVTEKYLGGVLAVVQYLWCFGKQKL